MSPTARSATAAATLARLGFADPARAEGLLTDPALAGLVDPLDVDFGDGLPGALSKVADPDLALLSLVRLMDALRQGGADRVADVPRLLAALHPGPARDRLLGCSAPRPRSATTCGAPRALARRGRRRCTQTVDERTHGAGGRRHGDPPAGSRPYDALRIGYRRRPAAGSRRSTLTSADPLAHPAGRPPRRSPTSPRPPSTRPSSSPWPSTRGRRRRCRLAVIGMGKCGGRELNYVSDVDVIFVAEPAEGVAEQAAMARPPTLAGRRDAGLLGDDRARAPSGRSTPRCGPRARTARSCAPSPATGPTTSAGPRPGSSRRCSRRARSPATATLGEAVPRRGRPLVWSAADRDRLRRGRAGDAPPGGGARSAGRGGPAAQAGPRRAARRRVQRPAAAAGARPRRRAAARSRTTLAALEALTARRLRGSRGRRATLDTAYRLLRTLEHRIQLLPAAPHPPDAHGRADLRRLGRSLGSSRDPAERGDQAVALPGPRGAPAARAALLPSPAVGRRAAEQRRGPAGPRGRARTVGSTGFRRPGRSAAPPRGAHRRGVAVGPPSSGPCCRSCSAGSPTRPTPMPACWPSAS